MKTEMIKMLWGMYKIKKAQLDSYLSHVICVFPVIEMYKVRNLWCRKTDFEMTYQSFLKINKASVNTA